MLKKFFTKANQNYLKFGSALGANKAYGHQSDSSYSTQNSYLKAMMSLMTGAAAYKYYNSENKTSLTNFLSSKTVSE